MTADEVAAIRARADAAMPGPWTMCRRNPDSTAMFKRPFHAVGQASGAFRGVAFAFQSLEDEGANATFIAHARADVPALCDALEAAQAHLDAAQRLLRELGVEAGA